MLAANLFLQLISTMDVCQIPDALSAKYKDTFAYKTMKDRMPVILTKTIDILHRNRHEAVPTYGQTAVEEIKEVIGRLSKLRNELQTNKRFVNICDEHPDAKIWNNQVEKWETTSQNGWFDAAWLFSECYMYRRVFEAFQLSNSLKMYDPFRHQKEHSLESAVEPIAATLAALQKIIESDDSTSQEHFKHLLQLTVWGNKCDLSFSAGTQTCDSRSPLEVLDELQPYLLVDHSTKVWNILRNNQNKQRILLDIVLDNAGFELFTDLCLVEFLMVKGFVRTARFHVKDFAWFISDTTERDFHWTLNKFKSHANDLIASFGAKWSQRLQSGQWKIMKSSFWTLPFGYNDMMTIDKNLYERLAQADLVLFKGDLNYRKLFHDLNWDSATEFNDALRQFRPSNLCALRTLKADIVVGLAKGQGSELSMADADWMVNGKYAVIQCSLK